LCGFHRKYPTDRKVAIFYSLTQVVRARRVCWVEAVSVSGIAGGCEVRDARERSVIIARISGRYNVISSSTAEQQYSKHCCMYHQMFRKVRSRSTFHAKL
jgi:hypothetical protein